MSASALRRACKIEHVDAIQVEYSLFERSIESTDPSSPGNNLLATARELCVAVIAYSPLGRGILTGTFTSTKDASGTGDFRSTMLPWFEEKNIQRNIEVVSQLTRFAKSKGCTTPQLALAWLLKQEGVLTIPGTKKIKYLDDNIGAVNVQLTDEEELEIRKLVPLEGEGAIAGKRAGEGQMDTFYIDTVEEK